MFHPFKDWNDEHVVKFYIRTVHLIIFIGVIACLISAGIYIIFRPDLSERKMEKSKTIGVSYMTMNNEFYKIINQQITYEARTKGDRIILRDPALSVKKQREQIEEMLNEGIDALILTPVEASELTDILMKAREKGVKIVVVDTELMDPTLADSTIVSDNYKAGSLIGRYYLQKHVNGARVVLMTHDETISGKERIRGFCDVIKKNAKIKIVGKVPCEGQTEIATPALKKFIDEGHEFDSVFCLNDLAAVGAAYGLESRRLLHKVDLYGVDASPEAKAMIYDGEMQATSAQFPTEIGKKAAQTLYRLLEGREVLPKVYVNVELVDRRNVKKYRVDRWQ